MSSVLYPPSRPQAIGEVLDCAFRIFRVTLLKCLPYSVMATIAGQIQKVYTIVSGKSLHQFTNTDPGWWGLYLLGLLCSFGFMNAILLRQADVAAGSVSRDRHPFARGLKSAPATVAIVLLWVLAVALCFVPLLGVPNAYLSYAFIILLIPGIYVAVLFLCASPALLLGGRGILGSLSYSVHLVKGNWWRTAMIYTVVATMIIVLSATAGMVIGLITQFTAARDIAVMTAVSVAMVVASGAIYLPLLTAMSLALYGDLEARKEGRDLERRLTGEPAT
jgi:hypothetical protein